MFTLGGLFLRDFFSFGAIEQRGAMGEIGGPGAAGDTRLQRLRQCPLPGDVTGDDPVVIDFLGAVDEALEDIAEFAADEVGGCKEDPSRCERREKLASLNLL